MNSYGIWDCRLPADLIGNPRIEEILDSILETAECMQEHGTQLCYSVALYDQIVKDETFAEWLFNPNLQPELSTFKRELSIRISKGKCISEAEYGEYFDTIEQKNRSDELFMAIHQGTENVLHVATPERYWAAKQWYLSGHKSPENFAVDLAECFPNLFFHERVCSSIHTLNGDFRIERGLIVQHLKALDLFGGRFSEFIRSTGMDYRQLSIEFQERFHIECSPQADRQSVENLKYEFTDSKEKKKVELCCELHTKLKWDDMDRVNQDRIYFHPGKPEIEDGKVLVVHIGTHL